MFYSLCDHDPCNCLCSATRFSTNLNRAALLLSCKNAARFELLQLLSHQNCLCGTFDSQHLDRVAAMSALLAEYLSIFQHSSECLHRLKANCLYRPDDTRAPTSFVSLAEDIARSKETFSSMIRDAIWPVVSLLLVTASS